MVEKYFSDPNGGAYKKEEVRVGPPLSYVGGKLSEALVSLHRALKAAKVATASGNKEEVLADLRHALYKGLVAYLALHNLLSLANGSGFASRHEESSSEDFSRWLDTIYREGSVTDGAAVEPPTG